MNDDLTIGSITIGSSGDYGVVTANGISPLTISTSSVHNLTYWDVDDFLESHIMNRVTVSHKVQEQELMKLKEVAPDYANEIKENIAKNAARDMVKKLTFTKKHDKEADVHHFIGRVWLFTEEELKTLLQEARNV